MSTVNLLPETGLTDSTFDTVPDSATGLRVEGIGKSYKDRAVVKTVSLSLRRGEAVGLLGPNGAGKTTCFYMITGLVEPDYGTISLDGHDITSQPMYQRARMGLGYLPQESSIFRGMTVEQNLLAVLELSEKNKVKVEAEVTRLLEELHITHIRKSPATALSGGERRRVEIARALAGKPSFILLDEPFAGIDPLAIADIRDVIGYLKARGIGILITDHNVRETLDIIDRASIIHSGEVLFEGTPDEIRHNPEVRRVYLGETFA
ncbi:LPS export ABC transporter ATP-binding protein [Asticcacaulis sp. YBE204]|uniref:LPS export ABC transporter ATP-binding protein n=1 Tax=Asticcacaulis sp. YBE204 TaxID=1282363 RepID=UPI0003C3CF49|nr:LPS export ABC transporter ATP-binding protein [Asticcacaulis sp. YBE204]ESQ80766.1 ABC transporter ATP-binding protein [Asticcacaulis sp. YBE204]